MDDEELEVPIGSALKLLMQEDLVIHSINALEDRIRILDDEIVRAREEIESKKRAQKDANNIFS